MTKPSTGSRLRYRSRRHSTRSLRRPSLSAILAGATQPSVISRTRKPCLRKPKEPLPMPDLLVIAFTGLSRSAMSTISSAAMPRPRQSRSRLFP